MRRRGWWGWVQLVEEARADRREVSLGRISCQRPKKCRVVMEDRRRRERRCLIESMMVDGGSVAAAATEEYIGRSFVGKNMENSTTDSTEEQIMVGTGEWGRQGKAGIMEGSGTVGPP